MSTGLLIGVLVAAVLIAAVVFFLVPGGRFIAPVIIAAVYGGMMWMQRGTRSTTDVVLDYFTVLTLLVIAGLFVAMKMKKRRDGGGE